MKKVLVIAYYFPPCGDVAAQRAVKFVKYLPKFGWQPVVLTARFLYRSPHDPSYLRDIPKGVAVHKVFNPEPTALLPWRIKSFLDDLFLVPDDKIFWLPFAVRAGLKIIKREGVNVIFATGNPWTALLVGQRLKELAKIPLVVDLRDPWTQNINRSWHDEARYKREVQLESQVLRVADHIITVSEPIKEMLTNAYPFVAGRISVIMNGYDSEDFAKGYQTFDSQNAQREKMLITNHGSFYGYELLEAFLKALQEIFREKPELKEKIEVRFIGGWGHKVIKRLIAQLDLKSNVKVMKYVEHSQNIRYLIDSDLLLLLIRPQKYAYSAKIFEYLASGKPILALVPPDGVAAELIRQTNSGLVIEPEDIQAIRQGILHFYALWEQGSLLPAVNWDIVQQFERSRLTQQLAQILDKVVS